MSLTHDKINLNAMSSVVKMVHGGGLTVQIGFQITVSISAAAAAVDWVDLVAFEELPLWLSLSMRPKELLGCFLQDS